MLCQTRSHSDVTSIQDCLRKIQNCASFATREKETPRMNKTKIASLPLMKKTIFKIVNLRIQIDLHKTQNFNTFLKYSKIEIRSETSKSGDRSFAIPVELPIYFHQKLLVYLI